MVLSLLISAVASGLIFCLVTIFMNGLERDKMEIEKRVQGLVTLEQEVVPEEEEKKKRRKREREQRKKDKPTGSFAVKTRKQIEVFEEELYNLGFKVTARRFVTGWVAAMIVGPLVVLMLGVSEIVAIAIFVVAFGFPIFYLKRKKKKRKEALEEQLVDAIGVLINAMRAGYTFQSAIATIAEDMEAPISEEFGRVFRETQRGITLEESLNALVDRVGSEDLGIMCTAINIQRQVGGNLSEILEKISGTIRQRISLKGEIKSKTSSGRVSGYIVGALPIFILLAVSVINPEYSETLLKTSPGHMMLIGSAVWETIGFIVIKKIVTVKY